MGGELKAAWAAVGFALFLAGCDRPTAGNETAMRVELSTAKEPPEGYGLFTFGQSFDATLIGLDVGRLNPIGLKECLEDLALRGCTVEEDRDKSATDRHDGIPYWRSFSFNKYDKLTDIGLSYRREGDTTAAECLDMHKRTLDWLTQDYGTFAASVRRNTGETLSNLKTAKGNTFFVWRGSGKDASFIVQPARNIGRSKSRDRTAPVVRWDRDRYVSLMTTFIVVERNHICDVDIMFSEPEKVERRAERPNERVSDGA